MKQPDWFPKCLCFGHSNGHMTPCSPALCRCDRMPDVIALWGGKFGSQRYRLQSRVVWYPVVFSYCEKTPWLRKWIYRRVYFTVMAPQGQEAIAIAVGNRSSKHHAWWQQQLTAHTPNCQQEAERTNSNRQVISHLRALPTNPCTSDIPSPARSHF